MHLYVHIPFCHRICPYCSFYKHTPASTDMRKFVDALLVEAESRKSFFQRGASGTSNTLYFGGGTPSMLSTTHLTRLIEGLYNLLPGSPLDEFSFEANPATFTIKKAANWAALGISRVSLGIQSWDTGILRLLGREHSPEQAEESVNILRQAGIRDVNIDLMFSIPGQSRETWRKTLEKTVSLNPEHISAYNLSYEEDTEFFQQLEAGSFTSDADADADMFEQTHGILTQAGYRHYETSNFAKNDRISLHNMAYWLGDDYIGIGPGAVSTINGVRTHNTPDTDAYIETTLQNGLPASSAERLDAADILLERIALLLRTDTGVPLDLLPPSKKNLIAGLTDENMATITPSKRLVLVNNGLLLADEIAAELSP